MIRHILLIKFSESVDLSQIDEIRSLFEIILTKIEGITSVEWGVNNSPENKNKGFTHSVLMTFRDESARDHYLPHPKHEELKKVFGAVLEDIVVFDYEL